MKEKLKLVLDSAKVGLALMCFVIILGLFFPVVISGIIVILSDSITISDCVLHPIFVLFSVIGMIISFFSIMDKIDKQNTVNRFRETSYR